MQLLSHQNKTDIPGLQMSNIPNFQPINITTILLIFDIREY
jgi:hypothetical protein